MKKTLYFECNMGAAGDMLAASLYELLPAEAQAAFIAQMNGLGIPGVTVSAERVKKCGIAGTHISVVVNGTVESAEDAEHAHPHAHAHHDHPDDTNLAAIERLISGLSLPDSVRRDVLSVYTLLAAAESHVHGEPVEQIHFHEIGSMDALADITGVCLLMNELAPDRVLASPVHVGCGQVRCAHGVLPVPAPATAYLLQGVPTYGGAIRGELCTPTGAALLKYFCDSFGDMPVMRVSGIGYGMGTKDFEAANCVRALIGETGDSRDEIIELCCNLDDMTPEALGFAQERLLEGGALDVYTIAVGMKKNRPGILLSCLCRKEDGERIARLMFRHTTTLGIRAYSCKRTTLDRTERVIHTQYGSVRIKESSGWGVRREKIEYDDLARIAREQNLSLDEASRIIAATVHRTPCDRPKLSATE